jgi:hypothetical protein
LRWSSVVVLAAIASALTSENEWQQTRFSAKYLQGRTRLDKRSIRGAFNELQQLSIVESFVSGDADLGREIGLSDVPIWVADNNRLERAHGSHTAPPSAQKRNTSKRKSATLVPTKAQHNGCKSATQARKSATVGAQKRNTE